MTHTERVTADRDAPSTRNASQPLSHSHDRDEAGSCKGEPLCTCHDCRAKADSTVTAIGQTTAAGVPSIVNDAIRSPGRPLDESTKRFMEPRFGHDFSRIRVHADDQAAASAQTVHARAYTVGHDLAFGANEYQPSSQRGRELLAHELAHTIQQRSGSAAPPSPDPAGVFETSAEAAGREVGRGRAASIDLPSSGIGLSRAPVPLEELPKDHLEKALQAVDEKLKQPAYEGRDGDLEWRRRLLHALETKAKKTQPVVAAPPPQPPPPPAPPPPDPKVERDAAIKEAEAVVARMNAPDQEPEEEPAPVSMQLGKSRSTKPVSPRSKKPPVGAIDPFTADYERLTKPLFDEVEAAGKRIDAEIAKDREISKKGSYEERLRRVRSNLRMESGHWYNWKEAMSRLTGEEVWKRGVSMELFTSREKKVVYEDQNSLHQWIEEKWKEAAEQARAKFEIEQYNRLIAQGEQLRSPAPFIQPFAFAALGPWIGAAYGGTQTGAMVGQAYNACSTGSESDCAASMTQLAGAVILQRASKGLSQRQNEPTSPTPAPLTFPRGVDVTKGSAFPAQTPPSTSTPQIPSVPRPIDVTGGARFPAEPAVPAPAPQIPTVPRPIDVTQGSRFPPEPAPAPAPSPTRPMKKLPGGEPRPTMSTAGKSVKASKRSDPEVTTLPRSSDPLPDPNVIPPAPGRPRNAYPDFEPIRPEWRIEARKQTAELSQQLGIKVPNDRVLDAPWLGRLRNPEGKIQSSSTSAGWLRNESRFWSEWQRQFPDDARLLGPGRTVTVGLADKYGWPTSGANNVVGQKLVHHHIKNQNLTVALPENMHQKLSGKIHARATVVGQ